ncbi:MAG: hypothetical protein NVSMB29_00400 [Candidatus Dormibacteria bacterium]
MVSLVAHDAAVADADPAPLPALPPPVDAGALAGLADAELERLVGEIAAVERATRAAMAPYDRQLRELRARTAEVATEQRRRERSQRQAGRKAVRQAAGSAGLPTLSDALEAAEPPLDPERPLAEATVFLKTGGEVHFGYPSRPGPVSFTNGREQRSATTLGAARELFAQGWEPGTTAIPGVRVHLAGTKIERVVAPDEVVLDARTS